MRAHSAVLYLALGCMTAGCYHRSSPTVSGLPDCPAPDAAGMSARLAEKFYRMRDDTLHRRFLTEEGISSAVLTAPVLVTDRVLCGRIAAATGLPPGASGTAMGAEGGAYYHSGPYFLYAPWRDYRRRAEWHNKGEFVGFVVLGPDLKVLTAIGM